jgi:hypothetical protein
MSVRQSVMSCLFLEEIVTVALTSVLITLWKVVSLHKSHLQNLQLLLHQYQPSAAILLNTAPTPVLMIATPINYPAAPVRKLIGTIVIFCRFPEVIATVALTSVLIALWKVASLLKCLLQNLLLLQVRRRGLCLHERLQQCHLHQAQPAARAVYQQPHIQLLMLHILPFLRWNHLHGLLLHRPFAAILLSTAPPPVLMTTIQINFHGAPVQKLIGPIVIFCRFQEAIAIVVRMTVWIPVWKVVSLRKYHLHSLQLRLHQYQPSVAILLSTAPTPVLMTTTPINCHAALVRKLIGPIVISCHFREAIAIVVPMNVSIPVWKVVSLRKFHLHSLQLLLHQYQPSAAIL